MQKENIMVGNIAFTENGVSVVMPYTAPEARETVYAELSKDKEKRAKDALVAGMKAIEARLKHCKEELEKNLPKAVIVTEEQVVWKDGHFSLPVYKAMEDLLARNPQNWDELNKLELQQMVRAIHCQRYQIEGCHHFDLDRAFMVATELLLCNKE